MLYTRQFQIGQTLDYVPNVSEARDEFRHGIIFGSWKQLMDDYDLIGENFKAYDERSPDHVLYCVLNQGQKCITWFYESNSRLICSNIARGKKILHENVEIFFKERRIEKKDEYRQMLLNGSIPEMIPTCQ